MDWKKTESYFYVWIFIQMDHSLSLPFLGSYLQTNSNGTMQVNICIEIYLIQHNLSKFILLS